MSERQTKVETRLRMRSSQIWGKAWPPMGGPLASPFYNIVPDQPTQKPAIIFLVEFSYSGLETIWRALSYVNYAYKIRGDLLVAVENVKLNAGDDHSRVAYEIALRMWNESKSGGNPKIEDAVEFLDLVQHCARALRPRYSHKLGAKPTD